MTELLLVDSGPLVALFEARDHFHRWAVEALRIDATLVTCEAVLSETCFLLTHGSRAPVIRALFQLIREGGLTVVSLQGEADAIGSLMRKYEDVPMSFADGCLVRLSELTLRARVMTCDRDFSVYRRSGRRVIPLLAPF